MKGRRNNSNNNSTHKEGIFLFTFHIFHYFQEYATHYSVLLPALITFTITEYIYIYSEEMKKNKRKKKHKEKLKFPRQ